MRPGYSVFRVLILFALVFAWGSPAGSDFRPAALERPLVAFHDDAIAVVRDFKKALNTIDALRDLRFMDEYFALVNRSS